MLSFDALAADVYWIRAIQHYGRDAGSRSPGDRGRFELLQPLLDLTTTLDPHFNIAYRFGAIFLALPRGAGKGSGPGRPDQAIALLEKGLRHNPGRWQYALDAGFINYWSSGNFAEAGRWFERAAVMPHAPEWIQPLVVNARVKGGDRANARELAHRLAQSEERYIRQAADRMLLQLDALDEIDRLQAAVEAFNVAHHAYPFGWQELRGSYPKDPSGVAYHYDEKTHTVSLSKDSSLSPLPESMTPAASRIQIPK
jgi:tetratricopeptide (TPR) repeat protein